ncbi:hypothetical protein [Sulfitobacter sp. R18_1]|uniref:hypothetical protein n=1 Tax=Sulfitobacter sp. R18_1 TaxID=2821104 RepID=UPI0032AF8A6C
MILKTSFKSIFATLALASMASACGSDPEPQRVSTPIDRPSIGSGDSPYVHLLERDSFTGFLTGYSYWDNTPPGSAAISHPIIHSRASGTGTYDNPVTIAVGHQKVGRKHTLDFPAGTRFYLPSLKKYAIVEDTCGDGNAPQNGPCHSGRDGHPWLDIYVDGSRMSSGQADMCMRSITGMVEFIPNPGPNYPVIAGPVSRSNC